MVFSLFHWVRWFFSSSRRFLIVNGPAMGLLIVIVYKGQLLADVMGDERDRGLPEWLRFSGEFRTRVSGLDGQFRSGLSGGDQVLATRTLIQTELDIRSLTIGAELEDSRHFLDDAGSPLNTGMVNTWEPLQAYLRWDGSQYFSGAEEASLSLGRQTLDFGSRRLVARNRFRNTINSFNGLRAVWRGQSGQEISGFYFLPVHRRPSDRRSMDSLETRLDEESFSDSFWGLSYERPVGLAGANVQVYLLGLDEEDRLDRPTRNRKLLTPGIRFERAPRPGSWDFDVESVWQLGTSRASRRVDDVETLDHFAQFYHASLAYTVDMPWQLRLGVQYDYASGDRSRSDSSNNRFDTLFGARRFEHGPTGIFGAFARSNIHSPGYRVVLKPVADWEVMTSHRFYWLASSRDVWTTSGLWDPSGEAGAYLGHQFEVRVRWSGLRDRLRMEAGVALLFAGAFVEKAPNRTNQGDSRFGYLQASISF